VSRSSLTIECKRPSALRGASVGQDANTRCSGCSTCVTSSQTRSRPINMRLVAHVAGKRPFFSRESCSAAALAPKKPLKNYPGNTPKIPLQLPYNFPARLTNLWRPTRCPDTKSIYETGSSGPSHRRPSGFPKGHSRSAAFDRTSATQRKLSSSCRARSPAPSC